MEKSPLIEQCQNTGKEAREALVCATMYATVVDMRSGGEGRTCSSLFASGVKRDGLWEDFKQEISSGSVAFIEDAITFNDAFEVLLQTASLSEVQAFIAAQEEGKRKRLISAMQFHWINSRDVEEYKQLMAESIPDPADRREWLSSDMDQQAGLKQWDRVDALMDVPLRSGYVVEAACEVAQEDDVDRFEKYMKAAIENIVDEPELDVKDALIMGAAAAENTQQQERFQQFLEVQNIQRFISEEELAIAVRRGHLRSLIDQGAYEDALDGMLDELHIEGDDAALSYKEALATRQWETLILGQFTAQRDLCIAAVGLAYTEGRLDIAAALCAATEENRQSDLGISASVKSIAELARARGDWDIVGKVIAVSTNLVETERITDVLMDEAFAELTSGDEQRIQAAIKKAVSFLDHLQDEDAQRSAYGSLYSSLMLRGEDAVARNLSKAIEAKWYEARKSPLEGYIFHNRLDTESSLAYQVYTAGHRGEWKEAMGLVEDFADEEYITVYDYATMLRMLAKSALMTLRHIPPHIKKSSSLQ